MPRRNRGPGGYAVKYIVRVKGHIYDVYSQQYADDNGIEYIENWRAKVKFRAKVTATAHPKVVSAAHGWWLPETDGREPNLFSTWNHNITILRLWVTRPAPVSEGRITAQASAA